MIKKNLINNISLIWIACLTFGLAPFTPPHLYEKLCYIVNGQEMLPIDWIDVVMHGSPWVLLILAYFFKLKK